MLLQLLHVMVIHKPSRVLYRCRRLNTRVVRTKVRSTRAALLIALGGERRPWLIRRSELPPRDQFPPGRTRPRSGVSAAARLCRVRPSPSRLGLIKPRACLLMSF